MAAAVGLLLVATGTLKLREPIATLRASIEAFAVVPRSLLPVVAALLPPLEIAIGFLVLVHPIGWVPWLAVAILAAYTTAIVGAIARGLRTECGCFGTVLRRQASWPLVARNGVLILLLLPALAGTDVPAPPSVLALAVLPFAVVIGLVRLFLAAQDLDRSRRPARRDLLHRRSRGADHVHG